MLPLVYPRLSRPLQIVYCGPGRPAALSLGGGGIASSSFRELVREINPLRASEMKIQDYLSLAGAACRVPKTFSHSLQIVHYDRGRSSALKFVVPIEGMSKTRSLYLGSWKSEDALVPWQ